MADTEPFLYPLACDSWDQEEVAVLKQIAESGFQTMGGHVRAFEQAFADYMGRKHAVMVNSGSSANLLAISALRYRETAPMEPGDEVIVPTVSWSTTYYPILQNNLKAVFVDIAPDTLNIDVELVRKAITPRTRAIFCVSLLGNPPDLAALTDLCKQHDLYLVQDNAESLGAKIDGTEIGGMGHACTYSFYFSHHMSTVEGGMVVTDDDETYHTLLSLRSHGWVRDQPEDSHLYFQDDDPLYQLFRFTLPGYNLRPTEFSGGLGNVQLKKLDGFVAARRRNASIFRETFESHPNLRIQREFGESSWFGFSLILSGAWKGRRKEIAKHLMSKRVQVRPIVAGNFLRNPVIKYFDQVAPFGSKIADEIDTNGFFVGNNHEDLGEKIAYLHQVLLETDA